MVSPDGGGDRIRIEDLEVPCIVGVLDWERAVPQRVRLCLELGAEVRTPARTDQLEQALDYRRVTKAVTALVRASRFRLLESLAEAVATRCLDEGARWVRVRASKPGALRGARDVAVEILRGAHPAAGSHRVYLGVGSNIDPETSICCTIAWLHRRFTIRRCSPIYEGPAVGPPGQPDFLNLVVEADTALDPFGVQAECRAIEAQLGRVRGEDRYAPRTCDLDLLLHDDLIQDEAGIRLPHPELLQAAHHYVPFCDLAGDLVHPERGRPVRELVATDIGDHPLRRRDDLVVPRGPQA
jgi:2-amino-4-hydroxy-6-hydroxymethyldihydropteridine diphosphokinase